MAPLTTMGTNGLRMASAMTCTARARVSGSAALRRALLAPLAADEISSEDAWGKMAERPWWAGVDEERTRHAGAERDAEHLADHHEPDAVWDIVGRHGDLRDWKPGLGVAAVYLGVGGCFVDRICEAGKEPR
ncbi:uncharacterized protein PpBr36_10777 [Pyricularia pennisetigena]|uniref:uncharacterized protein n=1 Tax=Pyricularia pennisetigena TaxID=1578925 RepID=UPI001153EA23|nr:uncharacterized protein PpBr36_10777 [Pyricularia pennisetigena]TLS20900.1 hypothetical protein PpBr36_10777 [Pyricularia pennisetigena]